MGVSSSAPLLISTLGIIVGVATSLYILVQKYIDTSLITLEKDYNPDAQPRAEKEYNIAKKSINIMLTFLIGIIIANLPIIIYSFVNLCDIFSKIFTDIFLLSFTLSYALLIIIIGVLLQHALSRRKGLLKKWKKYKK